MDKLQKLLTLILGIIIFLFLSIFVTSDIISYVKNISSMLGNIAILGYIVMMFCLVVIYHKKINNIDKLTFLRAKERDFILFILGSTLCILTFVIQLISIHVFKLSEFSIEKFSLNELAELFLANLLISSLEELFFRAFIFVTIFKVLGKFWFSLIISAVFFALVHINGLEKHFIWIGLTNIFIGGCLLAYLFYITNSIWSAVGFHFINNIGNSIIDLTDNMNIFILSTFLYFTFFIIMIIIKSYKKDIVVLSV